MFGIYDGKELRVRSLTEAMHALGGDAAYSYLVVQGPDMVRRYHAITVVGIKPPFDIPILALEGAPFASATGASNLSLSDSAPLNVFDSPVDGPLARNPWRESLWAHGFVASLHTSLDRALVTHLDRGTSMRGCVTVLFRDPERAVAPLSLRRSAGLVCQTTCGRAWDADTLWSPPAGEVLIQNDGKLFANHDFVAWAERPSVRHFLDSLGPGPALSLLAVTSVEAGLRWAPGAHAHPRPVPGGGLLVSFSRVRPCQYRPFLGKITRAQRRVASIAASGATAGEIAQVLSCSSETVRVHLKRLYATLGIGSRAELAGALSEVFV